MRLEKERLDKHKMEMEANWKAWTTKTQTIKSNEDIKRQEAEQAALEKKRSEIETQQATMQATEEENRRIAATCKTKCTANAVSKAMGEINKASQQVSDYCANNFPCAGELEKVRAEAGNIQK